ncbi:DUF6270 domain-containing protein [Promicromonospora sukumoe]|uniref:DUF6270 domain-containing protein n=1 Tax=Promicromonospora sukumoe TaxID=88382 RepID=UPI003651D40E
MHRQTSATDTTTTRVYIYGSCVTRDGVDFWEQYGMELVGYTARQSLISVSQPARRDLFDTSQIASSFQRRMAEADIAGNVGDQLVAKADSYDLVLWDLTDERLGVVEVPEGGVVSRVVPYEKGIYLGEGRLGVPTRLGDAAHSRRWRDAASRFVARLNEAGVADRIVVNATPWAEHDESGAVLSSGVPAPKIFNDLMVDYYGYLRSLGLRVAEVDASRAIARVDHKWGLAPFHYVDDTYRASIESALRAAGLKFSPDHPTPKEDQ